MPDIFLTGDTHFYHANIILYCSRPWLKDGDLINGKWKDSQIKHTRSKEMTEDLIETWNNTVKSNDIIYHTGDFGMFRYPEQMKSVIKKLHGKIYLCMGNHDKQWSTIKNLGLAWYGEKYQGKMIKINDTSIYLSHTAHRVWDKSHHGSWHCYGHSHGNLPDNPNTLSIDVGIDNCYKLFHKNGEDPRSSYRPMAYDELCHFMSLKSCFLKETNDSPIHAYNSF